MTETVEKNTTIFERNFITEFLRKIPQSYYVAVLITVVLLLFTVLSADEFFNFVKTVNTAIFDVFGDFYLWFVFITLLLFVAVGFSPLGKIKIGGKDAVAEHSFFSWFSMLFCAGMGIGLLFWGGAEPLFFYTNPPIEGSVTSAQKENMAFTLSFLHWGLHPWAIYGFTTLSICFFGLNLKRGIFFSSFISRRLSLARNSNHFMKHLIDNITVIAILFGIVTSFGMGVLQFEGGLMTFLGFERSVPVEILIIIGVTFFYMISTLRGLNKGIKVLSNASMILSFLLVIAIFIALPMEKIFSTLINAVPEYLFNLPTLSIGGLEYKDPYFLREWTTKYWTWWIAWAPFVGIFTTLVSKGRTVRELVFSMLLAPTLFSIVWFGVFGNAAILLQASGGLLDSAINYNNANTVLFRIIEGIFSSPFFNVLGLALVSIFFINSADSATYTLAAVTDNDDDAVQVNSKEDVEIRTPPLFLQVCWGVTFSVLTAIFLFSGGLEILQYITLIAVLPFSILLSLIFIKLLIDMTRYYRHEY